MTEHRWSKFWWSDYESDDALKLVSMAAQGLWMRMLCAMHRGTPHGHLAINGEHPTARQMAVMLCASEREIAKLLPELEAASVFSRTPNGIIYSRRLVRDDYIKTKAVVDGKKGGNPVLKRENSAEGLTPPLNLGVGKGVYPEAEAEAEAEADKKEPSLRSGRAREAAGSRLPQDWTPEDPAFDGAGPHTLAKFRDYWTAQPGAKGRKLDWQATWRNWCRREAERPKPKLHTLPQHEQDRRILQAAGLNFADPQQPAPVLPMRIAR